MRLTLPLALAALVLVGCAPEGEGKDGPKPVRVPGFEPASAEDVVVASARPDKEQDVIHLGVEELRIYMESGHIRLIDVRTAEEVAEGMIPGAEHIPLDSFDPAKLDPRNIQEVVLYCRSGRRSEIAAQELAAFTGEPAKHLSGGIIGWEEAGQEVIKP